VGAVIAGTHYRVLGLLGSGGMGSVYEVEHVLLGKRFVLKALLRDLARRPDLVARLRNEQRALARFEHPNLVMVTDAGVTSEGVPYFVMERLEGETLGARLKRLGRLPALEALEFVAGVLDGLAAAHEIGIVHRDVKPQNILLAGGRRAKLLDFGVAKVTAASAITARGVAVGTPRYMSPEQAIGARVDGRSDLYAAGLVLFEALVGRGPFDDVRDANEMLLAQLGRPAPPPSTLVPGITRELDQLVAALLAKNPDQRPPTARAAAAALRAVSRRYAGAEVLDAATPHAGYAITTQFLPVVAPPAITRAEAPGALSRRRAEAPAEDALTLARSPAIPRDRDTWIDEPERSATFAPRSPLRSANGTTLIGSHVTRTEVLATIEPARGDHDETHSQVPSTPSDGTRAPDPLLQPHSPRRRVPTRATLWSGLAVLIGSASLALLVTFAPRPTALVTPDGARGPSAPTPPAAALQPQRSAPPAPSSVPRPLSLTAAPLPVASQRPEAPKRPVTVGVTARNKKRLSRAAPVSGL
jgi:eukaryotic-like serine/threonine-protein kinase